MNKEELLKAIEQKRQEIWPTDTGEMAPATVPNNLESGWLNALYWMENFINSLPAEQLSERLGDEIDHFRCSDIFALAKKAGEEVTVTAQHFANWQKEQLMKNCLYDTEVMLHTKQNNTEYLTLANDKLPHIPVSFGLNVGDKVKILIIKEDKQ